MKNLRHSRKALSPVVASIILIAVTVAVSIAVAAWMGALTTGFMGSSSITITDAEFADNEPKITLYVKNTGTKTVTIAAIKINGKPLNSTDTDQAWTLKIGDTEKQSIDAAASGVIEITGYTWMPGNSYKFDIYDNSGQVVGSYQAVPPA
ncbi:MAG: archaellin/type IV pilin N-terminal domain-containing protein [Candidatus Bathyarchaeia archaeon]